MTVIVDCVYSLYAEITRGLMLILLQYCCALSVVFPRVSVVADFVFRSSYFDFSCSVIVRVIVCVKPGFHSNAIACVACVA